MSKLSPTSLAALLVLGGAAGLTTLHAQEGYQGGKPAFHFELVGVTQTSFIGVNLADIDDDRARALKLRDVHGVEITRIEENSPAAKSGLKPGDVVLDYNGQRVEGMEQFGRFVHETPVGREVRLLISRDGNQISVPVTIGARKDPMRSVEVYGMQAPGGKGIPFEMPDINIPVMPQVFETARTPILGIEGESLTPQLADFFGVKDGILVRSVIKDSAAEKAGIKAGDVITKVEQDPVTNIIDLTMALRTARTKSNTFSVQVFRDKHEMTITVTVDKIRTGALAPGRVRAVSLQLLKM